ncbi:MAG: PAS domain-containing protein [Nitrospinae bacterium]|nr:PAS domain-containing protein [Nitrospinota bacterium]
MNETVADVVTHVEPTHYVGIGASAGGLEALEAFFTNMPLRNGMSFIVVQHLSPNYKSLMSELLSKRTDMKVFRAEDGMLVSADCVYLIPPKKNLSIFHGRLILSDQDHGKGINLPIDIFLQSLAEDQREKSIAIILSGTGSDGVRGIRAIKESGGMVMVQNEESAKFDGMPKSALATGLADFILTPEEMPPQLLSFAKHPYVQKGATSVLQPDEDGLTRIFSTIRRRTKVDFTYYKPSTVLRRIERRMTVNQIQDLKEYVRFVESNNQEVISLYRELLIGVTNFFRDRPAFESLENEYLPDLLSRDYEGEVRFWVAGCSTGEEAYSLAITCRETLESMGRSLNVKIFATDVDSDALVRASNGVYPESIVADVTPKLLSKYFFRRDDNFQIARSVREMVVFAQHNLIKDPPFTNIQMVTCRNLLIYLQPVLQRKALEMFNFSLNAQGVLFLGSSETLGEMGDYFETLDPKWKIYRSKGKRKLAGFTHEAITRAPPYHEAGAEYFKSHRLLREHQEERVLDRMLNALTQEFIPCSVVVNDSNEVLHVVGDASPYLRLPMGKMLNDITKMAVKELAIPLANGIQKCFKTSEELKITNVRISEGDKTRFLQLRVKHLPGKKGQEPLVIVMFEEMQKEAASFTKADLQTYDISKEAEQRIVDLEQELQLTRENLQATIEELETSNEELQATNEELLASNEELQSTNEELHAVNEELYTVNTEYQRKIMALTELTNDVDNLLNSTQIGVVFLDENLEIRKFTQQAGTVFRLIQADVGRKFSHITHQLLDCDPVALVNRVVKSTAPAKEEVRSKEGGWYLLRAMPYQIGPETFSGVVITIVDLTDVKRAQEELAASERRYFLAQKAAQIGTWEWEIESDALLWSDNVEPFFGLTPGQFKGTFKAFLECVHPDDRPSLLEAITATLDGKTEYNIEHRIIWPDGTIRWMSQVGGVIRDAHDHPLRMVGVVSDVTERKRNNQLLLEGEERFRQLFQHIGEGVALHRIVTDRHGKPVDYVFVDANNAFERMTGLKRAEILNRRVTEVLPDLAKSDVDWISLYGKVTLSGEPVQFTQYVKPLQQAYSVYAFRSSESHFATIFQNIAGEPSGNSRGAKIKG